MAKKDIATAPNVAGIKKVLDLCKKENVKEFDLRFVDMPGIWQHVTRPISQLTEEAMVEGFGFDGSSIRGFQAIHESDMLLIPDPSTAFIDPYFAMKTVVLICTIIDPLTRQNYSRDPRLVAARCVDYIKSTGVADQIFIGPEAEFFIFDDVAYGSGLNYASYHLDSSEGHHNTNQRGDGPNLSYKVRPKEGYFPVPPTDSLHDIRAEMTHTMIAMGIEIETHHHEVATMGQCEIDMQFDELLPMADKMMKYKYVVKNTARKYGKTATFMPKPLFGDNGSGMHTHISFWKGGKPLFAGNGYAGLSDMAKYAIGGILKHAPAILAISNPTTNSYRRLVPGFEAPVNLAYSSRNRSASIRIPMYSHSPKSKRIEFRCPDPSTNPYLTFSALALAALDGVVNKTDPGEPLDKDIYDLPAEELAKVPHTPGNLPEALACLKKDHAFLLKGDVFTEDLIKTWIEYKTKKECEPMALRPHPYEFFLYYDI